MRSEYKAPKTVAKNPTLFIDVSDPRLSKQSEGATRARCGSEVEAVNFRNRILAGTYAAQSGNLRPVPPTLIPPKEIVEGSLTVELGPISNLVVTWDGNNLNFTFDFDVNDIDYPDNIYAKGFRVYLVNSGGDDGYTPVDAFLINSNLTTHNYTLTPSIMRQALGNFYPDITNFCVVAIDNFSASLGPNVCVVPPPYQVTINPPQINVSAANDGYTVDVINKIELSNPQYFEFEVWEVVSDAATPPETGWVGRWKSPIVPAIIGTLDLSTRWVKARFLTTAGVYTAFSEAYKVTPTTSQGVDTVPPNEVTINSVSWSGENIEINYSLPAEEEPYQFQITLTAPNSQIGYFYELPVLHNTTNPQVVTITKDKIFAQFSTYFSSYTGIFKGIDSNGNRSTGVSFNVPAKENPLAGITPTFSVTPTANGYIVTWQSVAGMTYADVYENSVSWGETNPTDELLRVYSGQSPVTIQSLNYTTRYIKIRFYDDYGNTSNYSAEQTVVPYDPGLLSLIENPVTFETNGSIIAGSYDEINSIIEYPAVVFNKDGIFAYDENGLPTTQLINTALAGQNTFITTQAQIADWVIHPTKIENTIAGAADTYTGLSGTGTYAIWAGSPVAGGSNLAKFWVKPDGSVKAQNIQITGGPSGGNVLSVGGIFTVTSTGEMTASSANIIGNITALTGTFKGNVEISSAITAGAVGSLYSGGLSLPNPSGVSTIVGDGFILNKEGLSFWNNSTRVTYIANDDDSETFSPGTLVTTKAVIGNTWQVDSSKIYGFAGSGQVILQAGSSAGETGIYAQVGATSAGIAAPGSASGSVALWAGGSVLGSITKPGDIDLAIPDKTPAFYVKYSGELVAREASIKGELFGGTLTGVSDTDPTHSGYYFSAAGEMHVGGPYLPESANYIRASNGHVEINIINGGFSVGSGIRKAIKFDPNLSQLRLSVQSIDGTNTTGLYLDYLPNDANWSKNDPVPAISDGWFVSGRDSNGVPTSFSYDANYKGRVVRGRRFYWGGNKVPPGYNGTVANGSTVVGFDEATAGDFFFSNATG